MPGVFSSRTRPKRTENHPLANLGVDTGPDNFTPTSLVPQPTEPTDQMPMQRGSNLINDVGGQIGGRNRLMMLRQRFQQNRRNPLGDNLNAPY